MLLFELKLACINGSFKYRNFRGHPPACVHTSKFSKLLHLRHRIIGTIESNQPSGAHVDLHLPRISIRRDLESVNWCKLELARLRSFTWVWLNWHQVLEWIICDNCEDGSGWKSASDREDDDGEKVYWCSSFHNEFSPTTMYAINYNHPELLRRKPIITIINHNSTPLQSPAVQFLRNNLQSQWSFKFAQQNMNRQFALMRSQACYQHRSSETNGQPWHFKKNSRKMFSRNCFLSRIFFFLKFNTVRW